MIENRALTPVQAAGRLQVSEDRVVRWLSAGHLRGLKAGDRWWTSTQFLTTFLEAHANRPAPKVGESGAHGELCAFKRRGQARGG